MSSMDTFFIQKTLEGYDAKIEKLEKQIEDTGRVMSNLHMACQAVQFQGEAIMHILIEKKGIITEEEAKEAVDDLYQRLESVVKAREEAEMQESENNSGV